MQRRSKAEAWAARGELAMRFVSVEGVARLPEFSHAVVAGGLVFVSGTLGTPPGSSELVPGGVGPQTRAALDNIGRVLEACGTSLAEIAKVSVFLRDMEDFAAMNEAYRSVFTGEPPARITVGGADLALGAAVEIECIASRPAREGADDPQS